MKYVKIISTPPGEAPKKVRDAWVGLTLPITGDGALKKLGSGVISRPKSFFGLLFSILIGRTKTIHGYPVDAETAVDILAKHAPEAARWWRTNTPGLLKPGQSLIFNSEVCQEISEDS